MSTAPAEFDHKPIPIYEQPEEFLEIFFSQYESPYSYRYGSPEMRFIWSETNRFLKAHDIWIAVAQTQMEAGLVSQLEVDDLIKHRDEIDIPTILKREMDRTDPRYSGHETQAAISQYADVAKIGARIIHQGMTSEDMLSNVEIIQTHEAFNFIVDKLNGVISTFNQKGEEYKDVTVTAYNHGQAVQSMKLGDRFKQYAADFEMDMAFLNFVRGVVKGKGMKGAVGTSASFTRLLEGTNMTPQEHERRIMEKLGLEAATITGQTSPRKYTLLTVLALNSIAQSCHKFAEDLKLLQSSPTDEMSGAKRKVSSSAMPGKKSNPITAETIQSLAREIPGKVTSAWISAANTTLERGMEDSAGKRSYLPESFLITDEILDKTGKIVETLQINQEAIKRNLKRFGLFNQMTETPIIKLQHVVFQRDGMSDIEDRIIKVLSEFRKRIDENKDLITTAYTHHQAAEPIPFGYRFARYTQDFLIDLQLVRFLIDKFQNSESSYNKYKLIAMSIVSSIAQSCHQFASDMTILQSSPFDEVNRSSIPPGSIKSSSQRFSQKPVEAFLATIDDPLESQPDDPTREKASVEEDLSAINYLLLDITQIIEGFTPNFEGIKRNLDQFAPFMALEIILTEFTKKGGDRLKAHEMLIELAQQAWKEVEIGEDNPLVELVKGNKDITSLIPPEELERLFSSIYSYIGDAKERCDRFLTEEVEPALTLSH